jgi:hypothetical protein
MAYSSFINNQNNLAEEAGTSVTFLLPYSLAYSGDRTA